jgi:Flp pilus assembly protein TadD
VLLARALNWPTVASTRGRTASVLQMPFPLAAAIVLVAGLQAPATDRTRAEDLARAGRSIEAIELFTHIVDTNPADLEARLWVARLQLRLGRPAEAEAGFRSVLREHPADVDAIIGLSIVLTRTGGWPEALAILQEIEPAAGQNADLFAAMARAYRRAGDDRRALEYFQRATALAPGDPDVVLGLESVARTYGHWIAFEGFGQTGDGAGVGSGSVTFDVRVAPRLHLAGSARTQQGPGYSDATAGGGVLWRAPRTTTIALHALGGPGNTALATLDVSGEVVHYAGVLEIGASVRHLEFAGSDLTAVSPVFAWDRNRWRVDTRYAYSRSAFVATGESTGDHSVLLRATRQQWRRVALRGVYAYGIESFEDLTADRLAALGTTTLASGVRIDLKSLTRINTGWEHQWRSNHTSFDRFTLSLVQAFP